MIQRKEAKTFIEIFHIIFVLLSDFYFKERNQAQNVKKQMEINFHTSVALDILFKITNRNFTRSIAEFTHFLDYCFVEGWIFFLNSNLLNLLRLK